jgi:glycosyltransferase involved in cell wall biosynthesis
VNSDLARRLTTGMARLPAERVVVVHNGGPEQRFLVHRDVERTELHVFFFGLLHPYNDFACLLDAAAQVRASGVPVVVHVAGEGSERGYLESRQEGDSLRLYGRLSRDEFAEIVRAAPGKRVGIACMRFGNGSGSVSPLKVFDYLALGMPVLHSDNILRDVLVDGEHGLAYRERDPRSLGEAMVQVLETSTYERMSAAVRELYPAYTWSSRMRLLAAALRRHV